MAHNTANKFNSKFFIRYSLPLLSCLLLILLLCLLPTDGISPSCLASIEGLDKVVHAILYAVLAHLMARYAKNQRSSRHLNTYALHWALISSISYGILIELLQANVTTYRSGEWLDVLANASGSILAIMINLFNVNEVYTKKN